MVKPVSLSDPAFAALRLEKRIGESDSDVVLRLIREARENEKDPDSFLRWKAKPVLPWATLERRIEQWRSAARFGD